ELELLTRQPFRRAAPVQGTGLGLSERLVVEHARNHELVHDGVDRLLDIVDDRRLGQARFGHPALQDAAQAVGGAGIALEIERGRVLQVSGGDRARAAFHASARNGMPTIACSASIARSGSPTLMVCMPSARAGFRLMPRSSRYTQRSGGTPNRSQAC